MPWIKSARRNVRQEAGRQYARQVTPGAELFALCQAATSDGRLAPPELMLVQEWLNGQHAADVPARDYVRELTEQILAAKKATPPVLQALYRALEPSLPAQLRQRRTDPRLVEREWRANTQHDEAERLRNEVLASAHFMVAGCQNERYSAVVERYARQGEPVLLIRDRKRAESPNAIQVCVAQGKQIGFVPEQQATELAPLLDRGARYRAHLEAVFHGRHARVLIVQAYLYPAGATLGIPSAGTRRLSKHGRTRAVWLLRIAVGMLIAASVGLVLRS